MGFTMKNKIFTIALIATGLLVSGSFAADRHIRFGGNLALGYNTVAGLETSHVVNTKVLDKDAFSKTEQTLEIKGADALDGFGFELGGSIEFPINNSISIRGNLLLNYRMHSGNLSMDTVITKYSDHTVSGKFKKESSSFKRNNLGDHSFNQFGLDIPVLCRMVLPTGDESGFYAEVGPVFTINLSTSTDDIVVKADQVNSFTMGLSVGVGRPLPFDKVPVDIDVHLVFGLMSMANDAYFNPNDVTVRVAATYWL